MTGLRDENPPDASGRLRVLMISHTCQSRTEGQPKAQCLGRFGDIELLVLVPDRWKHYGSWRSPDLTESGEARSYRLQSGKVCLPWAGPGQFYLHFYPGLRRLLKSFRPHIIDLWEEPWGLVSAHTCWLRDRVLPTSRIVSETEQNLNKKLPPPFEVFRRYVLQHADYVVARSSEAMQVLRAKGYTGAGEVVPNAVDAEMFRPLDRRKCRQAIALSDDTFVVGYVGRLVEEKGLADLVDAVVNCPANVRLVLAGSGPMREPLEKRIAAGELTQRVTFLGACAFNDLPPILNAMDVLVLPSVSTSRWKEQFGRVIIEAHACGVAVIGTSSGAIPDVVGDAGLLVPERDPAELAAAICRLAIDPMMCRSMGERGRRQVEAAYTWERVAAQMASIYRRVAGA